MIRFDASVLWESPDDDRRVKEQKKKTSIHHNKT